MKEQTNEQHQRPTSAFARVRDHVCVCVCMCSDVHMYLFHFIHIMCIGYALKEFTVPSFSTL